MATILKIPEVLSTICYSLSDHQILKMQEVCKDYWKIINSDKILQTGIAYRYLLNHQHLAGIPLDSIQYFLRDDRLVVDIKDNLSILGATRKLTYAFPWITHLIVRKGSTSQLQDLFKLVQNSTQLKTLFLFDCELNQACLSDLNCKILDLYFCNIKTSDDISFSKEKTVEIDDAPKIIEKILGEEAGADLLNEFQQKVLEPNASSEEVLQVFDAMKSSSRAKIISGIWYAVIMDPYETVRKPVREIQRLAREYIANHPHHPAVVSAAAGPSTF